MTQINIINTTVEMNKNIDQGWAWMVVVASFCTMFTSLGVFRSTSVIYVALVDVLGVSRENAAWPFTLAASLLSILGVFVGVLAEYFSIRTLVFYGTLMSSIGVALCYTANNILLIVIYFGIIFGIGSGLAKNSNVIAINQYFVKYRTMATGLSLAGSSIGSFVLPPLTEYLMIEYGLRGSFLLLSSVLVQSLVTAMLFRPLKQNIKNNRVETGDVVIGSSETEMMIDTKEESKFLKIMKLLYELFKIPIFYIIVSTFSFNMFCFLTYQTVVVDYASDRSIAVTRGVFIVSVFSFADLCGRLSCGWITDLGFMKRKNLVVVCCFGMGILFFCVPHFSTFTMMLIIALCLGIFTGCLVVNSYVLFTEYLGLTKLPLSLGLGNTIFGFINFAGPILIGYFRDTKGSYDPIFYILGGMEIFLGLCWLLEPLLIKNDPEN